VLSPLEDETPLELPPRASFIEPFTFHQQIGDKTSSNMMTLGAFLGGAVGFPRPLVAHLTGLQTALAFDGAHHFLHLVPSFVVPPHLCGGQGQSLGRIVLAAV
jgi:hypothetical protein